MLRKEQKVAIWASTRPDNDIEVSSGNETKICYTIVKNSIIPHNLMIILHMGDCEKFMLGIKWKNDSSEKTLFHW